MEHNNKHGLKGCRHVLEKKKNEEALQKKIAKEYAKPKEPFKYNLSKNVEKINENLHSL